jgi:hypothetical protein
MMTIRFAKLVPALGEQKRRVRSIQIFARQSK